MRLISKDKKIIEVSPLQELLIYDEGTIEAWRHIRNICNLCIKARKEEIKRLKSRKEI